MRARPASLRLVLLLGAASAAIAVMGCRGGQRSSPPAESQVSTSPRIEAPPVGAEGPETTAAAPAPFGSAVTELHSAPVVVPALRLATAVTGASDAGTAGSEKAAEPERPLEDATRDVTLTGKTVLHVGDSMVGGDRGLTRALEARFDKTGARFVRDYKVSESIVTFDKSTRLRDLLAKHRPDIVIVTLGANDVFVPYPQTMAANVQNIVKRIGSRECYWIGPPTWKPDTGIVSVIRENAAPCRFFDSSNLKLQRAGDGIHPTDRGGADWAERFWAYFRAPDAATATAPLHDAGATL